MLPEDLAGFLWPSSAVAAELCELPTMLKVTPLLSGASLSFCFFQSNHLKSVISGGNTFERTENTFLNGPVLVGAATLRCLDSEAISILCDKQWRDEHLQHLKLSPSPMTPVRGLPRSGMRGPEDLDLFRKSGNFLKEFPGRRH